MEATMFRVFTVMFFLGTFLSFSGAVDALVTVHPLESPNKEFKIEIGVGPIDQTSGRVYFKEKKILELHNLGFQLDDDGFIPTPLISKEFIEKMRSDEEKKVYEKRSKGIVLPGAHREVRNSWKPPYGERDTIPENYCESVVEYKGLMKIIFRAYDEGVAFCYEFETKENEPIKLKRELTEFCFEDDYPCWAVYSAQGVYAQVPLSKVKKGCERPLLVEVPGGPAISIGEARLVDFARMKFQPSTEKPTWLTASLDGAVEIQGTGKPYRSPWRFVMAADYHGKLVEHNYMLKNLNDPCVIADTSWIKPGKVIREVTLTTEGGKACVDFALDRNLQYIEYDAGWYGYEEDDNADATTVTVDPKRNPKPNPLDLPAVIAYAKSKGIDVLLYVNRQALERQLDDLLPVYKKWGVSGIKYGFVSVGSQRATTWLHDAVKKTAEHGLVVDVHDEYRVTGWERTYPNLLTVEGIAGNETRPTTQINCTLAFTRTLCGAGDYTHCWYKTDVYKGTRAHQLATVVVFYSPLQFLFWYDRPSDYKAEPELDFWKTIPTVWNETRVLNGEVSKFATFARRTGNEWYVGTISANEKRTIKLPLDFLDKGKKYEATLYSDHSDDDADRLKVRIVRNTVDADTVLDLNLAPNGGAALRIVPQ